MNILEKNEEHWFEIKPSEQLKYDRKIGNYYERPICVCGMARHAHKGGDGNCRWGDCPRFKFAEWKRCGL